MICRLAVLCLIALLSACGDQNNQIPPNRVDQGSYIGAPGSGAP